MLSEKEDERPDAVQKSGYIRSHKSAKVSQIHLPCDAIGVCQGLRLLAPVSDEIMNELLDYAKNGQAGDDVRVSLINAETSGLHDPGRPGPGTGRDNG